MEKKLKHLEFIQNTINRMAGNLFFLRGWIITLISGMIALLTTDSASTLLEYFLLVFILVFWMLDGYFLSQERLYRSLYNDVRKRNEEDIDLSMNTDQYKDLKENTIIFSMYSKTLAMFYLPFVFISLILIFIS